MRRRCIASLAALAAVWQLAEAPAYSHHSNVAFAVETVLTQVDTACLELLDVRVPGSPALTRHQRCS